MDKLTTEASKPKYSNPVVEEFDKYIASNGDPKKFMETMYGTKDYTKVSMDSEADKKQVLSDYLARQNPERDSAWIEKKIQRYEDSNVLDDEAADALDELKTMSEKQKGALVAEQQKQAQVEQERYRNQLNELQTTLTSKKDIAGIPVTQKDMKDFYSFLTQADKDGMTPYEKTLAQDKEAVIKMAYIAYKKFDVNNLKSNVKSDVVKDVKKALSRFSATNNDLQSRTGLPAKSNRPDYKDFETGL